MTLGSVHAQTGASGFMPMASTTQKDSISTEIFDASLQNNVQDTEKISSNMSSQELLAMLTQNTATPMSNLSSSDLLSLLESGNKSSSTNNNSNNLMSSILSAYSNDSDSDDKNSYSAAI